MSLYDDLGVDPGASTDDINRAYRKAAKAHHPDAGGDPEAFARIGHAVAVQRDADRRAEYDKTGREEFCDDNPEGRALAQVQQAFATALQAFAEGQIATTQDLMCVVVKDLKAGLTHQKGERQKAEKALRCNADALKRLSHKGDGPDVLARMLEGQATRIAGVIAAMKGIEADISRAIELAANWEWRADQAPEPTGTTMFTFTTPSGFPDDTHFEQAFKAARRRSGGFGL